jgi:DNA repair protein RadA/Sms
MKKSKKQYVCSSCGSVTLKWGGQCFDCKSWGSIEEENVVSEDNNSHMPQVGKVLTVEDFTHVDISPETRIVTPTMELNRVLGGGIVVGSAVLLGGDPGIGKSTLLLQLTANLSNLGVNCLYVTGEESTSQVKLRGARLGLLNNNAKILSETNSNNIIATLEANKHFNIIIIDSIQTLYCNEISSAPGTVSQIRTTSHHLISHCKQNNISLFLVGHVTKDGQLAGPKVLEHMVDTVLYFEGDENYHFRILRAMKNRFGPVNEIGVFEMTNDGLVEVTNPSALFLSSRTKDISGSSIFAAIQGSRPLLVEIQALISPTTIPMPRRVVVGWDANRLAMLLAVLSVRYSLNLSMFDVYLSIVGGFKITEPAADLAVAAAIISAAKNHIISQDVVFFGEIGLSGEVRKVSSITSRINEAMKLGFNSVICNHEDAKQNVIKVDHIAHLKNFL